MHRILKTALTISLFCLLGFAPLPTSAAWSLSHLFHHTFWSQLSDHFDLTDEYLDRPEVRRQIRLLAKNQPYLFELSRNARPYIYYVAEQTKHRDMPAEIALLPMVESNYDPFLYSNRGATGLWQIMPGTASGFGLEIKWWYDGRRDITASTKAALNYLEYLHHYFHDWLLAMAAYDSGAGTVRAAIRKNKREHKPTDFWSLPLPRETKLYIPKLLAIADVIRNSDYYGVTIQPVPNEAYFTSITLHASFSIAQIADLADSSTKIIRKLNPGFRRSTTIRKNTYECLIPIDKLEIFKARLAKTTLQSTKHSDLTRYQVKKGDTLAHIAARYHTTISAIKQTNHLKSDTIRIGQILWIPSPQHKRTTRLRKSVSEDYLPGPRRIAHIIKPHDTLSTVAHHYHVSMRELCFWNGLTPRSKLHPNQELTIWKPHRRHSVAYVVKRGDTLGQLAERFSSSISEIRRVNHLKSNEIQLGQRITIPVNSS